MSFNVLMAIVFTLLALATLKPRPRMRGLRYDDDYYEPDPYEGYQPPAYRAPPPVEPQAFTEDDMAALTRKMSAEDAETLSLFHRLNNEDEGEPEPEEITDLRNSVIRRGWRPQSDTAPPTLTGTIVEEVPDQETPAESTAAWEEPWYQPREQNWEEPDLLRDGVDVTMRKLALMCFGPAALEQGSQAA